MRAGTLATRLRSLVGRAAFHVNSRLLRLDGGFKSRIAVDDREHRRPFLQFFEGLRDFQVLP